MSNLQIQDFATLVQNQVIAIQGRSSALIDLSVGSILRAVVEAYSAVAIWLQGMILQLLAVTRAATSSGPDLDSWVNDYGVTRLPSVASAGQVVFSRFTPTLQAVIPIGAMIQTTDGAQQYSVTLDVNHPSYSAEQGGYVVSAGVSSISVPVVSQSSGLAANALANGINTLGQSISGIDTVSNQYAFTNGIDAESDTALRARFVSYIQSLSKATRQSVGYAASSVQSGLTYTLVENQTIDGFSQPGFFYLVVDDGSGMPPQSLLDSVYKAVDPIRPLTTTFGVFAPTVLSVDIGMLITTADGYDHTATIALVSSALTSYINSLGLGSSLAYTRLAQIAYGASLGVSNVSSITLNGDTNDIPASSNKTIKVGTISIS